MNQTPTECPTCGRPFEDEFSLLPDKANVDPAWEKVTERKLRDFTGPTLSPDEWSKKIKEEERVNVFEVGANSGDACFCMEIKGGKEEDSFHIKNENVHYYAFEPTPELCDEIEKKYEKKFPERYHLFRNAVSEVEEKVPFYISDHPGCSSLNAFEDNLDVTWGQGRAAKDFKVHDVIEVETIRLDSIIKRDGIKKIHYLHIDTQGNDLKVLRSLGDYVSIVQEGRVEVPKHDDYKLYKDQHGLFETLDFLHSNDFEIYYIDPDGQNEHDLYFIKRGLPVCCDFSSLPPPSHFAGQMMTKEE